MSDLIPRGRVDAATRSEALAVLHAYADGDLLTRVEAANDPEVQRMVRESFAARGGWSTSHMYGTPYRGTVRMRGDRR